MSWPSFWLSPARLSSVPKKRPLRAAVQALLAWGLRPLGATVCGWARYRLHKFHRQAPARVTATPVVVVGNLVVGGAGKTPFIEWLAQALISKGWRVGIVSRGYGGQAKHWPQSVTAESSAIEVGDEPVWLAQCLSCPVAVSPKRVDAIKQLVQKHDLDVIISDDGLQHFAMARDLEVVMLDAQRGLGNQRCLPAGPLREPTGRLHTIDWVVSTGPLHADCQQTLAHQGVASVATLTLQPQAYFQVRAPSQRLPLAAFKGQPVTAMAGIGNPQRFFETLSPYVGQMQCHAMKDHHPYRAQDLAAFAAEKPLIMTAKDAVKCKHFAPENAWALSVAPEAPEALFEAIEARLQAVIASRHKEPTLNGRKSETL